MRDWVNDSKLQAASEKDMMYDLKYIRLERVEPMPKMNIYTVQPRICYLPNYENYIYNDKGTLIERKFTMEEETLREEIDIKDMSEADIIKELEKRGIKMKEDNKKTENAQNFGSTEDL